MGDSAAESGASSDTDLPAAGSLTVEDCAAPDIVQALVSENRTLRESLAKSNSSMKSACEKFVAVQQSYRRQRFECQEMHAQARQIVASLQEQVQLKEEEIQTLTQQQVALESKVNAVGSVSNGDQVTLLKTSLEAAMLEKDELQKRYSSLEARLDSMVMDQQEQDRATIETLRKNVGTIQSQLIKERKEKQELSDSLDHLRVSFDDLLSEYEKLIGDEKVNKSALLTKDNQIRQLQLMVQKLHSDVSLHQTEANIFRSDFEAERRARESLHDQCTTLKAHLTRLTSQKAQQNSPYFPASASASTVPRTKNNVCVCPKCGLEAPDMKTLQVHYNSCMS